MRTNWAAIEPNSMRNSRRPRYATAALRCNIATAHGEARARALGHRALDREPVDANRTRRAFPAQRRGLLSPGDQECRQRDCSLSHVEAGKSSGSIFHY